MAWIKPGVVGLALLLFAIAVLAGCGSGGEPGTVLPASEPNEDAIVTIGNLTDLTTGSAGIYGLVDLALEDLVRYYNEENLISGVELTIATYDTMSDPARIEAGYEWLREREADVIFSATFGISEMLRARLDEDRVVLFERTAQRVSYSLPGFAFAVGSFLDDWSYTFLDWIAENDWDYVSNGPAKLGAADWASALVDFETLPAMEEYCVKHPDQFEWVGAYLTDVSFTWGDEIDFLGECDYVVAPNGGLASFARDFRAKGYTSKLIGGESHAAVLNTVRLADMWDETDGMLFLFGTLWWNDEGRLIDLTRQLLREYHPDEAGEIMSRGFGYLGVQKLSIILEIIRSAAQVAGPQGVNSEAIYNAAQSFSMEIDDYSFSYGSLKRAAVDYFTVYEMDAAEQDLFRLTPGWIPVKYQP